MFIFSHMKSLCFNRLVKKILTSSSVEFKFTFPIYYHIFFRGSSYVFTIYIAGTYDFLLRFTVFAPYVVYYFEIFRIVAGKGMSFIQFSIFLNCILFVIVFDYLTDSSVCLTFYSVLSLLPFYLVV